MRGSVLRGAVQDVEKDEHVPTLVAHVSSVLRVHKRLLFNASIIRD